MRLAENLTAKLREDLTAILLHTPDLCVEKRLVRLCHTLALVFVKSRIAEATRENRFLGLSYSDIAFDSIAELFQRDDAGNLVQLEAYFRGIHLACASDQELLSHVRRLVFSKVNQNIFRIYNESDPSLGRILRNIKLAVASLNNFQLISRFDETCIVPSGCETLEHLPIVEREELEKQMRNTARGTETIPQLLAHLSLHLRQQTEHSLVVPMITAALVFRALYQNRICEGEQSVDADNQLTIADASGIIHTACLGVKKELEPKYVGKGKVSAQEFASYFHVIEEQIVSRTIGTDGDEYSFFSGLKQQIPELTEKEYRKRHKSKIEYLGRLAYEKAIEQLRKNM
jgi:hypothetical protein